MCIYIYIYIYICFGLGAARDAAENSLRQAVPYHVDMRDMFFVFCLFSSFMLFLCLFLSAPRRRHISRTHITSRTRTPIISHTRTHIISQQYHITYTYQITQNMRDAIGSSDPLVCTMCIRISLSLSLSLSLHMYIYIYMYIYISMIYVYTLTIDIGWICVYTYISMCV